MSICAATNTVMMNASVYGRLFANQSDDIDICLRPKNTSQFFASQISLPEVASPGIYK
jgi:hypothetical protein